MNDIFEIINNISIRHVDIGTITNLMLALICGIGIFAVYYITNQEPTINRNFSYTLILLPLISAMIAIIVSSDFILAVSMLGALSIIRFRYSMKEPKNLVFIFWAVTAGLTAGVNLRVLTVIWCALIGIVTLVIYFINNHKHFAILTIQTGGSIDEIESILRKYTLVFKLKYKQKDEVSNLLFEVKCKKSTRRDIGSILCDDIMQLQETRSVKFIEM